MPPACGGLAAHAWRREPLWEHTNLTVGRQSPYYAVGIFRKIDPSDLPTPGPSDSAYTVSYPAARGPYRGVWALPVLKWCAIAAAEQAAAMERLQFYERTNSPAGS